MVNIEAESNLLFQEEDLGVPWSGVTGDPVQYGGMYYPQIPGQQMHHPMGTPVRCPSGGHCVSSLPVGLQLLMIGDVQLMCLTESVNML